MKKHFFPIGRRATHTIIYNTRKEHEHLANKFKQITKNVLEDMSVCEDLKGKHEHPVL